jgi:hypothetical protein
MRAPNSLLLLSAFLYASNALALTTPPPTARPVIVGTSEYSNVLFGKLQRAAALWGTNLQQPTTVVCPGDKSGALDKCLWKQFYMANPGSDGILSQKDLLRPIADWMGNDLEDTLLFVDLVSPKEKGLLSNLPFVKKEEDNVATINPEILQCAVDRGCAHIYVLANEETLGGCYSALEAYSNSLPSTILALNKGVSLKPTQGWTTSRPQNMKGEFVGPVALGAYDSDVYYEGDSSFAADATLPMEDAVEVMMHMALRTDRSFKEYPRIITLSSSDNANIMAERPKEDYFTRTGNNNSGPAGTVLSVASWQNFFSPLGGQVNTELGDRPDQQN